MMIDLPEKYLERMRKLPGMDFGEFLKSYEEPSKKGLRFSHKARPETIRKLIREWGLEKIPWAHTGYFYPADLRPGLSPYHDAGLFYIQEPSAMAVAEAAGITPDDAVLDLCAAPGGKSTRAAELAKILVSNEIIPSRAKILSSNIERMGIRNSIVCSTAPDRIADCLCAQFDVVIVDAPCSGEGMMRKDETAIREWSVDNVELCAERQRTILTYADTCVKDGGKLVYSTCTFEPCENEKQIERFLIEHPEYTLLSQKTFYPHIDPGEGQYYAVLKKGTNDPVRNTADLSTLLQRTERALSSAGIHILRSGIMAGEHMTDKKKKDIYIPSHAEIMSSVYEGSPFENAVDLSDERQALSFLKGNQLSLLENGIRLKNEKDGYLGVYYDGYPLGLGKMTGNVLKNHLPKGLRRIS
ncbi:MAG: RNA methyltransferase [Eubacteriales bacterium]|nr:RNA methyltransferase [Eubacteriales bacterium]